MTEQRTPVEGIERIVVVGGGLAGGSAATTLREEGFGGSLVLVAAEPHAPYERPPLSKGYLQGTTPVDEVYVHAAGWYPEHDVELRTGARATAVDPEQHTVRLADGALLPYDRLLLATGSVPRRLDVPGAGADGVRYLRTLDDSTQLRRDFAEARHVTIIGGGWIGLETAAAARTAGLDVTVVETAPLPLVRVLGPEAAQLFADLHTSHGVDLRLGTGIATIEARDGRAAGVVLSDRTRVATDLVVVGVGVTPDIELAEAAGLATNRAVVVDDRLQSSDPDIFVAGDAAEAYSPPLGRHVHVEHWANAKNQGPLAAQAMLGQPVSYRRLPYFYTDQYDLGMEYTGDIGPDGYDRVVFRGDPSSGQVIVFWLRQERLLAGMCVNVWDQIPAIGDAIRSGQRFDADRLADPSVPIGELSAGSPP